GRVAAHQHTVEGLDAEVTSTEASRSLKTEQPPEALREPKVSAVVEDRVGSLHGLAEIAVEEISSRRDGSVEDRIKGGDLPFGVAKRGSQGQLAAALLIAKQAHDRSQHTAEVVQGPLVGQRTQVRSDERTHSTRDEDPDPIRE